MANDLSYIAIVILAAGASSRLGRPKQLLPYKNTNLLGHGIETARATGCKNIVVVTGAHQHQISEVINSKEITMVHNNDWESGMASSIKTGINFLQDNKQLKGVLIMLCDQPLIDTAHLNKLIALFKNAHNKIVATSYEDITGVPAIFPAEIFNELLSLSGDQGARQLILQHGDKLITIPFEGAALDIDTEGDYEKLSGL